MKTVFPVGLWETWVFGGSPLIQYHVFNYYHHILCAQNIGEDRADDKPTKPVKEVRILHSSSSGCSQNILAALL